MEPTFSNERVLPQQGWVAAPGTAGISQRVTSDQHEQLMSEVNLKVLEPLATQVCAVNEY
jgi:hypothetical protein